MKMEFARANRATSMGGSVLLALCLAAHAMLWTACNADKRGNYSNTSSYFYNKGLQEYQKGKYVDSIDSFINAAKLAPDNPQFLYCVARASAAAGRSHDAIQWLDRTVAMGFHFDVDKDSGFEAIRNLAPYKAILKRVSELKMPVGRSERAFTIHEPDLMPESITFDPVREVFFVGSTYKRKVVAIDSRGVARDFIGEAQDGLWSVLGIKIDPTRRVLWVLSSVYRGMKGFDGRQFGLSAVYAFHADHGNLLKKYILDERPKRHSLNDIVVSHTGDVYMTDDQAECIYWIANETGRLEVFAHVANCTFPNGICLSDDETRLYVGHTEGVSVMDLKTKAWRRISHPDNLTLCGLDGLYFYKNSLVGVQNYQPERIVRFLLGDSGAEVTRVDVMEANNPLFELPTTGVIVKDEFYYIANSQLRKFDRNGVIFPMDKLNEIAILKTKL